jgi:hypothetical protein
MRFAKMWYRFHAQLIERMEDGMQEGASYTLLRNVNISENP